MGFVRTESEFAAEAAETRPKLEKGSAFFAIFESNDSQCNVQQVRMQPFGAKFGANG
jgi:hypothetical protein